MTDARRDSSLPPIALRGLGVFIQIAQRSRQSVAGRRVERLRAELCPQGPPGARQPDPDRAGVQAEYLRERRCVQVVPVAKLEENLLLHGQQAQRAADLRELLLPAQLVARRADQLVQRRCLEVYLRTSGQAAHPHVQLVPGDRKQVRPERRVAAELIARANACEERLLDEVIGFARNLVLEEA